MTHLAGRLVIAFAWAILLGTRLVAQAPVTSTQRLDEADAGGTREPGDRFGERTTTGDFDGDGIADLAVGAPRETLFGNAQSGTVRVVYGSPSVLNGGRAPTRVNEEEAGGTLEAGERFGEALAAGDFDGDGIDDLAVGAPYETLSGQVRSGTVRVVYGSRSGINGGREPRRVSEEQAGGTLEAGEQFGEVLAAGDFNGDGFDDLAVGAPMETLFGFARSGNVRVVFGSASGLNGGIAPQRVNEEEAGGTVETGDRFGAALAAGDFDGDGVVDLAIGTPNESVSGTANAGRLRVVYGSRSGFNRGRAPQRFDEAAVGGTVETNDRFSRVLAAGDFDGDGLSDLAIGVPNESSSGNANAGRLRVIFGSPTGINGGRAPQRITEANAGGTIEAGDQFGFALAAGDFDGDGHDDLAVGAPFESVFGTTAGGRVRVLFGSPTGLNGGRFPQRIDENDGGGTVEAGDQFGHTLSAGDFNGDGDDDLAISAPYEDVFGETDAGRVRIVFGALALPVVDISVKVILDGNGNRPRGNHVTDAQIRRAMQDVNEILANNDVLFRVFLSEIHEVAGAARFVRLDGDDEQHELGRAARADPARFGWRDDAINVFVVALAGDGAIGRCSLPGRGESEIITINSGHFANPGFLWLHEIGHFLSLLHTFECFSANGCDPSDCQGEGALHAGARGHVECSDVCSQPLNVMNYASPSNGARTISACQRSEMRHEIYNPSGSRNHVLTRSLPASAGLILPGEEELSSFRRGDADGSGELDIADAIRTLSYLFTGGVSLVCQDAADVDDSGELDIADAVNVLSYLFLGRDGIAAPGPEYCSPDSSADALDPCSEDGPSCFGGDGPLVD